MYSFELHQVTVKKPPENAASAFYDALYAKNWAKIRENPYFLQKSRYLKITFLNRSRARNELFLLKFGQVIVNNRAKKCYNLLFQNFPFLALVPQILVKNDQNFHKSPVIEPKNENFKKVNCNIFLPYY